MFRAVAISLIAGFVVACAGFPAPSVKLRELGPQKSDHVRMSFSTDKLSKAEAQEVLLLCAALVSRKAGGDFFQFRTVSARGLTDELTGDVRYYDVRAVVDPLTDGENGDEARKTYRAEGVIDFLGPKYRPLLPKVLATEYAVVSN